LVRFSSHCHFVQQFVQSTFLVEVFIRHDKQWQQGTRNASAACSDQEQSFIVSSNSEQQQAHLPSTIHTLLLQAALTNEIVISGKH
jgi:hypothetical protein